MNSVIGIATTTCTNKKTASGIVDTLLFEGLIACGQIEGPIESSYIWDGKLNKEPEWRIVFKFPLDKAKKLEKKLNELHSYENPQWTTWKAEASQGYVNWVRASRK